MKTFVTRFVTLLSLAVFVDSNYAFAHGDDNHIDDRNPPKLAPSVPTRFAAKKIGAMDRASVATLEDGKKLPSDVAIVRCLLDSYPCRGISISLLDMDDHSKATSHTGFDGVAGFEGLVPNTRYRVRVVSEKYIGESELEAGRVMQLGIERKSLQ